MMKNKFHRCVQINLRESFGGGEVFTALLARNLKSVGFESLLLYSHKALFWDLIDLGQSEKQSCKNIDDLFSMGINNNDLVVIQGGVDVPLQIISALQEISGAVVGYVHLPFKERSTLGFELYDRICPVSNYVRSTLLEHGLSNVHDEPCLGSSSFQALSHSDQENHLQIMARSVYEWDKRKFRDRLFSWFEPLFLTCRRKIFFAKPKGVTLGIVSRIATIKQFPLMFSILAPIIAEFPDVHLCIFGSGGYSSIRDLKKELKILGKQVSFWGHQNDVQRVYSQIDWLLSGLPEKEALGLNIIEAQVMGIPVLAVDAPPFTETVCPGVSGIFFTDPRVDSGSSFRLALEKIVNGHIVLDREKLAVHLVKFSEAEFAERFKRFALTVMRHK